MARKYIKREVVVGSVRKAKCGHWSNEGRYFVCENCKPKLPQDSDWLYFGEEYENEEVTEEV